jgi:hypothetical protein
LFGCLGRKIGDSYGCFNWGVYDLRAVCSRAFIWGAIQVADCDYKKDPNKFPSKYAYMKDVKFIIALAISIMLLWPIVTGFAAAGWITDKK